MAARGRVPVSLIRCHSCDDIFDSDDEPEGWVKSEDLPPKRRTASIKLGDPVFVCGNCREEMGIEGEP